MKYFIRVQVVEYTDDTQKSKCIRDLKEFARIARIAPLSMSSLPGGDCFQVDLDKLPEHTQLQYLHLLDLLSARNPHFVVELRDTEYNHYS
jgi:hypothetical protein